MIKTSAVWLATLAVGALAGFGPDELGRAAGERASIEREIALAKAPGLYVVIDFERRGVELKSHGETWKRWEIVRSKAWGREVGLKILKIENKSALFQPKRTNITPKPGKNSEDYELDVLEVSKMPTRYSIFLEGNVRLRIRPKTKNLAKRVWNLASGAVRYAYLPLKTVWASIAGKSFTDIEIVTRNAKDAKGIYWALFDGLNCLIYRPN
jgi:hypothetical protein